jgi:hypothetical protein
MKWIEFIVVRAVDPRHKSTVMGLVDQLILSGRPDRPTSITLYHNAFVDNDLCIHLQWDVKGHEAARSDLGIELARALEELGRVHHTIWIQTAIHPE